MEKDGERFCDSCGQVISKTAKLAVKDPASGRDLCLACSIRQAQIDKGLHH
jgi:hypothetical protein